MALKIQIQPGEEGTEHTRKVALEGRLDQETYQQCEKDVEGLLAGPVRTLIFDLKDLNFISSAGIRVLISAQKKLSERNGSVILSNMQPQIAKVLEIIKALPGISIFRNTEELDEYLALMQRKVIEGNQS